jgi:hypothetical protein
LPSRARQRSRIEAGQHLRVSVGGHRVTPSNPGSGGQDGVEMSCLRVRRGGSDARHPHPGTGSRSGAGPADAFGQKPGRCGRRCPTRRGGGRTPTKRFSAQRGTAQRHDNAGQSSDSTEASRWQTAQHGVGDCDSRAR